MPSDGKHRFTDKEHRQHDHIVESEEKRGVSPEKADEIGWATVNKQKTANDALLKFLSKYAESDPCWDGYEMVGTKKKNGKTVPNCVPKSKKEAADNRAMDLERQIKDSNKSKSGKKYFEPAGTQNQPRDKGVKMPKDKKDTFKSASVTEALFNIYQEAYGVQVGPGSGGNYSMGPSIDTSSKQSVDPGQGAQMDTVQWKTKDKKIPKSKLQPGQDPIVPGKMKEAPRYTMMTPDQKVNYVKDDAGNLVNNKSNGLPKTTPGKYDRSPLTEDSLRQLYPSLYESDNKQPGKLRQFVDWLKGIHQQTFGIGAPKLSPDELAEQRIRENPIQAAQIQKFVKTAVADDNSFRIILAAMNEMGYTSGDILAAFS